ncbi:MAG: hypothetical protein FWC98_00910 [Bacteroidales bacterium]|nr:hypothetical protein [Bacteroidales bacterium]
MKQSVLIFTTILIVLGCRKEEDASLVGIWVCERAEIRDVVFGGSQSPLEQALIVALLSQGITEAISGMTFEFRADGIMIMEPPTIRPVWEVNYTASGGVLSISFFDYGFPISGIYSISRNTLNWDIQLAEWFRILRTSDFSGFEMPDFDLDDLNIESATIRLIFDKK